MFLLVTRNTKLEVANGAEAALKKGAVLQVAEDCPLGERVVQLVLSLDIEPSPFKVADGFDFQFTDNRCSDLLEYNSWETLRAAAGLCRRRRARQRLLPTG